MKKAAAVIVALFLAVSFSACKAERKIIEDVRTTGIFIEVANSLESLSDLQNVIVLGKVTKFPDATYYLPDGTFAMIPRTYVSFKVLEVIAGDVEKGQTITFDWTSGYLPVKEYLKNLERYARSEEYAERFKKYENDPNAYVKFNILVYQPILNEGDTYLASAQNTKWVFTAARPRRLSTERYTGPYFLTTARRTARLRKKFWR